MLGKPGLVTLLVLMLALVLGGCAAKPGIDAARFQPCPMTPNCVNSDAKDAHAINPISVSGDLDVAWQNLQDLVAKDRSMTVVQATENYLHVTAKTAMIGFVDDLEFERRGAQNEIAIRSASRIGISDLGANRRRLESLRERLQGTR